MKKKSLLSNTTITAEIALPDELVGLLEDLLSRVEALERRASETPTASPVSRSKPKKSFLRAHEQAKWLGVHPRTIKRIATDDPTFPPEICLSEGLRVRSTSELEAWVERRRPGPPSGNAAPIRKRGRPRKYPLAGDT